MRPLLKPPESRVPRDAYMTPPALAMAICQRLKEMAASPGFQALARPDRILEPHAGAGAFVTAARAIWTAAEVCSEDLQGHAPPGSYRGGFNLVLGNPPFGVAEDEVQAAIKRLRPGGLLAFILRLSFSAGVGRVPLYEAHPLVGLIPIAGRPSFTGDGRTDASEYGVFIWGSGLAGGGGIGRPLVWKP
jgi:hypothetical protein